MADYKQVNGIALAYMGDAIYEVYIMLENIKKAACRP